MKGMVVWMALLLTGYCQAQEIRLVQLPSVKVPVCFNRMTNLVFPVGIRKAVWVSKDVVIRSPGGIENVLELQAAEKEFAPTNLSVYGSDGRLYSFDLTYADSALTLNFSVQLDSLAGFGILVKGWPIPETTVGKDADSLARLAGSIAAKASDGGVVLRIKGIYLKDGMLWLGMRVSNHTKVPFRPDLLRLSIVDKSHVRRMAQQSQGIEPLFVKLPGSVVRDVSFAVGYPVFTIGRKKRLVLQLAEVDGGRVFRVKIGRRLLLRAKG